MSQHLPSSLPPAPAPAAVLETALYAADLDAAEAFYGRLLGLERITRAGNRHVFYRVGPGVLLIFSPDETETASGTTTMPVPPHGARGPGHMCFAMDRDGIAALRARLLAAGLDIDAEFDWPNGAHSLYVRDPAGNSVEFAEPRLWRAD
ncbi:VOC family protein [Antarcticimicrobium luteum]|uniref:Glyoxalase/bleomycin resistance/extradiol dioxygenase family protein n=1 Tax=Antarcticimicrobium luteum TaxID=2547397 RepID=A0A4R5VES4_9RHOB|nr:VOC family protein [Antarcticimicrobium luteum]TDK50823.1 glyoxalase/bleomycin resistance/extradiol dioxygenase family protein [Antarcticimicrobium luteum]